MRRRRRPGVVAPVLRLAAGLAVGVASTRLAEQDEAVRAAIAKAKTPALDRAVPVLTDLGSTYAMLGAAAVLYATGRRRLARDVVGAGALAWGSAQALKAVYRRPRPYHLDDIEILVREPAGLSFPSGHPALAAAVARVLEDDMRRPARRLVRRIPRFVAFSRVYAGVHHPTDVVGGLLIGRAIGDLWRRYAR